MKKRNIYKKVNLMIIPVDIAKVTIQFKSKLTYYRLNNNLIQNKYNRNRIPSILYNLKCKLKFFL